jgi:hypothetical protein
MAEFDRRLTHRASRIRVTDPAWVSTSNHLSLECLLSNVDVLLWPDHLSENLRRIDLFYLCRGLELLLPVEGEYLSRRDYEANRFSR